MGTRKYICIHYQFGFKRGDIMVRKSYVNISIPKVLVDEIDIFIVKKTKGYISRAEFVKDAVRQLLLQIKK